jgi:hypothetical protein
MIINNINNMKISIQKNIIINNQIKNNKEKYKYLIKIVLLNMDPKNILSKINKFSIINQCKINH